VLYFYALTFECFLATVQITKGLAKLLTDDHNLRVKGSITARSRFGCLIDNIIAKE
jgi:hypothetical protein